MIDPTELLKYPLLYLGDRSQFFTTVPMPNLQRSQRRILRDHRGTNDVGILNLSSQRSRDALESPCIALRGSVRTVELEKGVGAKPPAGGSTPAPRPNHNDYRYNRFANWQTRKLLKGYRAKEWIQHCPELNPAKNAPPHRR